MKFLKPLIVFLIINFGALAIGTWLMQNGPQNDWYLDLNKAPWTPDGWVFGAAWFSIMVCFSIYMTFIYLEDFHKKTIALFIIQFILNVAWNLWFFNLKLINIGLLNIVLLTIVVFIFLFTYYKLLKWKSVLILPYAIWLCIATSLNLYIFLYN